VLEQLLSASATFARPANTTAYAANDAVSDSTSAPTVLTFNTVSKRPAVSGYVVKARLITDQSTNTAQFRLWLYHTAPTAINDNAAFTYLYADRAKLAGYVDLGPLQTEGSGSDAAFATEGTVRLPFVNGPTRALYGLLETKTAFTPASGQNFYVEITTDPA
jgi:hypothetical protein